MICPTRRICLVRSSSASRESVLGRLKQGPHVRNVRVRAISCELSRRPTRHPHDQGVQGRGRLNFRRRLLDGHQRVRRVCCGRDIMHHVSSGVRDSFDKDPCTVSCAIGLWYGVQTFTYVTCHVIPELPFMDCLYQPLQSPRANALKRRGSMKGLKMLG